MKLKVIGLLALVLLAVSLVGCTGNQRVIQAASGRHSVLLVIAPQNFRDEEYFYTMEALEDAGIHVDTASKTPGVKRGMLGGHALANLGLSKIDIKNYDAIVFIGGSGVPVYYHDKQALELAKEAYQQGKIVGAICLAPGILAYAGILKNKTATIWDNGSGRYTQILKSNGARYVKRDVVVDGKIVTANGTQAAREFGDTIARMILKNTTQKV